MTSTTIQESAGEKLTMNTVINFGFPFVLILQLKMKEMSLKNSVAHSENQKASIDTHFKYIYNISFLFLPKTQLVK